jgi:pilus assembly protein CpaE
MDTLNYTPDKISLILNRAHSLSSIRIKDVEKGLQKNILLEVPSDGETVVASVNRGQPLVLSHPGSSVAKAIGELACHVIGNEDEDAEEDEHGGKGILGGLFGKR